MKCVVLLLACFAIASVYGDQQPAAAGAEAESRQGWFPECLSQRRLKAVKDVYANLIYPKPLPLIASAGNAATFFHPNVTGRITPAGTFAGRQNTVEYFYALGNPVSGAIQPGQQRVIQTDILVLDVVGPRVSIYVNLHFSSYPGFETDHNLTQIGWFGFKPDEDVISFYDLTIIRLGDITDIPAIYQPYAIQSLCNDITTNCQGPNKQFANFTDCVGFLTTQVPYGSWNNAMTNTVVCRQLHNLLTRVRPEYHCPHVGPTGGGKCVDSHTYKSWYDTEYVVSLKPDRFLHC